MADNTNPKSIQVETIKEHDFKTIFIDGVAGDLNPERGTMTFYYDVPNLETSLKGEMSIRNIERHLAFDVRMSPEKWVQIAHWMKQNADYYEKWKKEQSKEKQ